MLDMSSKPLSKEFKLRLRDTRIELLINPLTDK